ncbi:hypothetical protein AB4114_27145 [Paenibacillus sp. 2RAB27]|uniref:hypothetical protein n=1 Tax=Paenibacillus sp. 2RAB27 TaxID=3232991 RepID=UPI003F9CDBA0
MAVDDVDDEVHEDDVDSMDKEHGVKNVRENRIPIPSRAQKRAKHPLSSSHFIYSSK